MKVVLSCVWELRFWLIVSSLLGSGCNDEIPGGSSSSGDAWSIESPPSLEVGGDPETPLGHVIAATRLPDATIVVADDMSNELSYFSATGAHIATVGGAGMGPEEFQHVWWIGNCGVDSVYVWDMMRRRMTVWSSRGELARQFTVPAPQTAGPPPFTITCSQDRVFAYQEHPAAPQRPTEGSVVRGTGRVLLADASGNVNYIGLNVPSGEMVAIGGGGGPRPLGKNTSIAVANDVLYIGTADSAYVGVFAHDGRAVATVALDAPPRPATRAHFERAIEAITGSIHARTTREVVTRRMLGLPMPDTLPPYTMLLTDPLGSLWVVLTSPGDSETLLHVLDESGRSLAHLAVPMPLTVHEVGRDYLLASYLGADGSPRVGAFALQAGRSRAN